MPLCGAGSLHTHLGWLEYVSIGNGARIVDSRIRDSTIGTGSTLSDVNLAETIIGNRSDVSGKPSKLNVGDSSEVNL